jgi:signal transduction histidine kinase
MSWQFTPLVTPTVLALVVSFGLLLYVGVFYREHRRDPVVVLYFCTTLAAIVWTGFSALKLLHTDPETKLLFFRLLHVGAATLPPLLFLFAIAVTDRTEWLRYDVVGGVFLLPAVFLVLLFVNPEGVVTDGTRLIEGDLVVLRVANGTGFFIFALYSLGLAAATIGLVTMETRRVGRVYYPQAALITLAVLAPILFTLFTQAGVPPFTSDQVNLIPTASVVSVVLFGVLLFRYRLVDLPPLAYATAMKYSPDALFVLDQQQDVVSANERGNELLDAHGTRVGTDLSKLVPGFDPAAMQNELVELGNVGSTGYYRLFIEQLTRGGRALGWVVVLRDETAQQRQQDQLEEKNEQIELFASTISHDLRNPLNVAQIHLEMVQEETDIEELDKIARAHGRMEEIIDDVLTLARAEQQVEHLEERSVETMARQTWQTVKTDGAELAVEADRGVKADPTMVQHVFENLFRNAVEHAGDDPTITVGTLERGFFVEDDGDGIPPDERAEIFDVGYTDTSNGTGLGLSIVKEVVEAHGWDVRATESAAGGARFEITGVKRVK